MKIQRVAQSGSVPALDAGGREFESHLSDQRYGERSLIGRALGCDPSRREFDSHRSPQFFN